MRKIAFLFPGQGSQRAGMGSRLSMEYPEIASEIFLKADRILEYPISRLCFEGPEDELKQTENAQPGIFLASMAVLHVLQKNGIEPDAVAGHSLGEYSALVASGSLEFEAALMLVRKRGLLMAEVGRKLQDTAMAAIMGIPAEEVTLLCESLCNTGCVEVANFNSPQQTVISGKRDAVEKVSHQARQMGAKAIPLKVSAPFHSSLMKEIKGRFGRELDLAKVDSPKIPVIANFIGDYVRDASSVREALREQVDGSVRWYQSVERFLANGFTHFVEVGPGKVLTGLMKQIAPKARAYMTDEKLEPVLEALARDRMSV